MPISKWPRHFGIFLIIASISSTAAIYLTRYGIEVASNEQLAALLYAPENFNSELSPQTKFENCEIRGPLPDPECTPGAVFKDTPLETICVSGYTKTVRSVSQKLRKQVYASYNIPYPQPFESYELDHLIPLAIGGSNEAANLFPESANPKPGFREKDVVEVFLREEVCARRIDLAVAQTQIAKDWLPIWKALPSERIKEIKNKYKNWSN